jgi:pantoate--beta-alanine ligase
VNPKQFVAGPELDKYPRDLPGDLAKLEAAGVDLVFTPTPDNMYPPGYQTTIRVENVSQGLEGAQRPGHFSGVATVVAKLFNLTQPTTAYFGQKDAQQVVVIRCMARDLNFPLEIAILPTVREPDGLAMSSRNVYLNAQERALAANLYAAMRAAAAAFDVGERQPEALRQTICDTLKAARIEPDYISVADPRTLIELDEAIGRPVLLSLAAKVGTPRLLDNMLLPESLNTREGLTLTLGA